MSNPRKPASAHPGFVVLKEVVPGVWHLVGEVDRQPGLAARAARIEAVKCASGNEDTEGVTYAAVLRSEWRIAQDY